MAQVQSNQKKFNFLDTTATRKVFSLHKRIRAVSGGTSASKTISILVWLIDYSQTKQEREKISHIVSESLPHLKLGAVLDFENLMKDRRYWDESRWNKTEHEYTFETGNKLKFLSVDTYGKAHGPRRDVLFINEANNLPYNIVDQLITRTREVVWLDWNPSEEFWFYTEMLPKRKDVDFLTLTYLDNEALDEATIIEIESHKDNKNWWNVYGLGQLGVIESRIHKDWAIIDELPHEARLISYGLDFGYTNDPTALSALYYLNGGYIVDEITYTKGLSNRAIADILLALPIVPVVADSAEPKSIDELRLYGLTVIPATKGKGSVSQGIAFVQAQRMSITKRSVNFIKSYRNYNYITDKNGVITNEPDHYYSDGMDSVRYGLQIKQSITPYIPYVQKPYESHGFESIEVTNDNQPLPMPFMPKRRE